MRMFHGTIAALAAARADERDAFEAVDEAVGWAKLLRIRGEVEDLANLANEDPLLRAADRWRTMRKFAPDLIEALEFCAARAGGPMLAALQVRLGFGLGDDGLGIHISPYVAATPELRAHAGAQPECVGSVGNSHLAAAPALMPSVPVAASIGLYRLISAIGWSYACYCRVCGPDMIWSGDVAERCIVPRPSRASSIFATRSCNSIAPAIGTTSLRVTFR